MIGWLVAAGCFGVAAVLAYDNWRWSRIAKRQQEGWRETLAFCDRAQAQIETLRRERDEQKRCADLSFEFYKAASMDAQESRQRFAQLWLAAQRHGIVVEDVSTLKH